MCALIAAMLRLHLYKNLVGFWPVLPEFNCVEQAAISDRVSISTFARWQHCYISLQSARGDTVAPSGLYSRLCHAFLVCFFNMSEAISGCTEQISWFFLPNWRYSREFSRSVPVFPIPQGTLPWQPILCRKKGALSFQECLLLLRYETDTQIQTECSNNAVCSTEGSAVSNGTRNGPQGRSDGGYIGIYAP